VRAAAAGVALAAVLAVAGCSDGKHPGGSQPGVAQAAVPARSAERSPAATAGGACQLLDFYAVEELLGVHFDVAASSLREATATCVLQHTTEAFPDLTLAITPTAATVDAFKATGVPPGATPVTDVGAAAYQLLRPAVAGADPAGPGISLELGWLTKSGRLMVVRYRFGMKAEQAEAEGMVPHLVELAKFLDA
jgi:hypothetical protein